MEVLYRKYRPKKFSEIVGQDSVKKVLTKAIERGEVSHAYIFSGPRGTGKTTTARILAKALNCDNRQGAEPCGKCYACKSIDDGTYMDVIELDAASNRGIDEIRKIRDAASFRPIEGKYKVYIIDEVHMLTREAFNALLKTLEEPPEHVVFVLATTNIEKVPATILSRCQVFEFKNLPEELIVERLKFVAAQENIDISEEALLYIAKRALGGMRDALTMLEQVWKFSEGKITVKEVENALGLIGKETIEKYVNSITTGDVEKLREVIKEVYYSGKDFEVLLSETVEYLLDRIHNGDTQFIQLLRELTSVLKDVRYFENKKLFVEVASISLMKEIKTFEKKVKSSEEAEKEEKSVEKVEDESEKIEKVKKIKDKKGSAEDNLEPILNYLKEDGDLSLYVALSMLDEINFSGKEVELVYSTGKELQAETVKEKMIELEELFRKFLGKDYTIRVVVKGETAKTKKVKQKLKKMALFENEGE